MAQEERTLSENELDKRSLRTTPTMAVTDIERISIANIHGPLVIFYGPAGVGKTVTLLRLCRYIAPRFTVDADHSFRNDLEYSHAVEAFEMQRMESVLAPEGTGAINFLLLNISLNGSSYCQILEAPGEHFFPSGAQTEIRHPFYMQKLFQSPTRKVFVVFFERQLMADQERLELYSGSLLNVFRQHLDGKRDRVIIVFNKCDERPDLNRNGKPVNSEFKKLLYRENAVRPLAEFLRDGQLARVPFVPFSSGKFGKDSGGRKTFAMSADHYPKNLWEAIHDCIKGGFSLLPWNWW